jgi:hypothetical protein
MASIFDRFYRVERGPQGSRSLQPAQPAVSPNASGAWMQRMAQHADAVVQEEIRERDRQRLAEQKAAREEAEEAARVQAEQQKMAAKQQAEAVKVRAAADKKTIADRKAAETKVVTTHEAGIDATKDAIAQADRQHSVRGQELDFAATQARAKTAQAKKDRDPKLRDIEEEEILAEKVAADAKKERLEWERQRQKMDETVKAEQARAANAKEEIKAGGGKTWLESITGNPTGEKKITVQPKEMPGMPLSPAEKEKVRQSKLMEKREQAKRESEALIGADDETVTKRAQEASTSIPQRAADIQRRETEIVTPVMQAEARMQEIFERNKTTPPPRDGRVLVTDGNGQKWHPDVWREYELALNGYNTLVSNTKAERAKLQDDIDQFEIDREVGESAVSIANLRAQKKQETDRAALIEQRKAAADELRSPVYGTAATELEALDAQYDAAIEQMRPELELGGDEGKAALESLGQKYQQDRQAIIGRAGENRSKVWDELAKVRNNTLGEFRPDKYLESARRAEPDPPSRDEFDDDASYNTAREKYRQDFKAWQDSLGPEAIEAARRSHIEQDRQILKKAGEDLSLGEVDTRAIVKDIKLAMDDWSEDVTDPAKQGRVLSDGRVVVNPRVWLDPQQYEDAVNATDSTPKAKEAALAILPQIRQKAAQDLIQVVSAHPDLRAELDKLPGNTDEEKALAFQKEARRGGTLGQTINRLNAGVAGIAESGLGVLAAITGQVKDLAGIDMGAQYLEDSMRAWGKKSQAQERAAQEAQTGFIGNSFSKLAGGAVSTFPSLVAGAGTGGVGAALGLTGKALQTASMAGAAGGAALQAGGSTYSDALEAYTAKGMPIEQARREALVPSLLSAVSTGALTYGFGAKGVEAFFRTGEGREAVKRTLGNFLKEVGKGSASEGLEELTTEAIQSGIEIATFNPDMTARQVIERVVEAGALGAALGGGFEAVKTGVDYRSDAKLDALKGEALLTDSNAEIDNYTPPAGVDPQGVVQALATARLVRDIAQGTDLETLTDKQLSLVGIRRDAQGELKNAGANPLVKLENGNPIITQPVIDQITNRLPLTGKAIGMSEVDARQYFKAKSANSDKSAAPAQAENVPRGTTEATPTPQSVTSPTGENWSYTRESGEVVTVPRQGANSVADAATEIQKLLPAGETVERGRIVAPSQPKALASRVVSDTMKPETIKARANQIGENLKQKGKTGQGAAVKLAGNFLAKYANRYGAAFSGIRYEDGKHKGSGGVLYDGRTGELVVDTEALAQTVARSGNREAAVRSRIHEEAMHHVIGARVGRQKTAELWRMLPDSVKRASMGSYEAAALTIAAQAKGSSLTDAEIADVLARVSEEMKARYGDEDEDATRGEEFLRQLLQKELFDEVTEVASEYPGLAGFIKQLLDDLVKALEDLASHIQNPAARKEIEAARDAAAELARELGLVESKAPPVVKPKAEAEPVAQESEQASEPSAVSAENEHPAPATSLEKNDVEPMQSEKAVPEVVTPVDAAAHMAATSPLNDIPEPTEAQKEAGNYQKGHTTIGGLKISIENPAGSTRSGTDADGKAWSVEMQSHYGYVLGTEGEDGDHVDVFIKPGTPQDYDGKVFVIDQMKPDGSFDEAKVILGAKSAREASELYHANYATGWEGMGAMKAMSWDQFGEWVKAQKPAPVTEESTASEAVEQPLVEDTAEPAPPAPPTLARPVSISVVKNGMVTKETREATPELLKQLVVERGKYKQLIKCLQT